MKRLAMTGAVVAVLFLVPVGVAPAVAPMAESAGGCVTRGEYDNLAWGLSTDQVDNRFGTNGWLIWAGDEFFRRGYEPCWTADRKIVVWYDLNLGLSDRWDVR